LLFSGEDDGRMVKIALAQNRVILTKDSQVMKRRLVTSGRLKAVLIKDDDVKVQLQQVVRALNLDYHFKPFSICLECNQQLQEKNKNQARELVPPYVFKTQSLYMECPSCRRLYWRGTHWQAMTRQLEKMAEAK
jgi:uncharacterized protein with PIN domain